MLRVQGAQTLDKVEEELAELLASRDPALQLPVSPKEWWLGGELALIQLIITWSRMSAESTLVTHVAPDESPENQLKSFANRLFGFVALLLSSEIRDRSEDLQRSLKRTANEQCAEVVSRMYGPIERLAMGSKAFLVSVDHSSKWAIPWLYKPNGQIHDRNQYSSLAQQLVRKVATSSVEPPIPTDLFPKFGAILHELFKNTEEWGKSEVDGRPFRRSVRGISAERHRVHRERLPKIKDDRSYSGFFSKCELYNDHYRFLEFSIFDSGIGLARRWLKAKDLADISIEDEFQSVLECLKWRNTSSDRPEKGIGLAEVYRTLNQLGAFLYLRSGRLGLFRDFRSCPLTDDNDVTIFDLSTGTSDISPRPCAWGTCFQIIVPLTEKSS